MKSFTNAVPLLALAALSSAAPTKRQNACILQTVTNPDANAIVASIQQWNTDVVLVNDFLNSAAALIAANDPTNLAAAASDALGVAADEPCQLMTLASVSDLTTGPAAYTCAVQDLMNVFGTHVLDNLNTIIANPSDTTSVQNAVDDINVFRCCNVLGDASILWQDSSEDAGVGNLVNPVAPFPDACQNIICTNSCSGLDNDVFGTPGDGQSPAQ